MKQRAKQRRAIAAASLLFIVVAVVGVLTAAYAKEGNSGPLHTVQLGAAEVLRPLYSAFSALARPFEGLGDKVDGAFSDEEERLRRELAEREAAAARASFLAWENARLRGLLEGERKAYEYGPLARVIAPVGEQFTKRVTIDVGTEDGVGPNEPVVVGQNTLVGRTTDVYRNTARVVLLTDRSFAAGVRIVPPSEFDPASGEVSPAVTAENLPYGQGLLRTDLEGYLEVDLVLRNTRAEEGDFVVTRGRAGGRELLYPPGLYVGTVESSSAQDADQYKKIVVEPAMNPDDIEEVRVITDWQR